MALSKHLAVRSLVICCSPLVNLTSERRSCPFTTLVAAQIPGKLQFFDPKLVRQSSRGLWINILKAN